MGDRPLASDSLSPTLGKKPEYTEDVIEEVADENWGYSGMLADDWMRDQGLKPADT